MHPRVRFFFHRFMKCVEFSTFFIHYPHTHTHIIICVIMEFVCSVCVCGCIVHTYANTCTVSNIHIQIKLTHTYTKYTHMQNKHIHLYKINEHSYTKTWLLMSLGMENLSLWKICIMIKKTRSFLCYWKYAKFNALLYRTILIECFTSWNCVQRSLHLFFVLFFFSKFFAKTD